MQGYLGFVYVFLAATMWGLLGPVSLFSLKAGFDPLEVAFWRAFFGATLFIAHALFTRSFRVSRARDGVSFLIFGIVGVGGFFAAYQGAVQKSGAALASVLLYTAPAWVAVFSRIFFKEELSWVKVIAIAMSLAGAAGISLSGGGVPGEVNWLGVFLGMLSGLLYSTHYIFSKHYLARYSTVTLYGFILLFGALALLPFVPFKEKTLVDFIPLGVLGLVCTYGAYLAYCEGVKRLALTRAAVLATLEPVMATIFAWWWWQEEFSLLGWIGTALIIGAVLFMVLDRKKTGGRGTS